MVHAALPVLKRCHPDMILVRLLKEYRKADDVIDDDPVAFEGRMGSASRLLMLLVPELASQDTAWTPDMRALLHCFQFLFAGNQQEEWEDVFVASIRKCLPSSPRRAASAEAGSGPDTSTSTSSGTDSGSSSPESLADKPVGPQSPSGQSPQRPATVVRNPAREQEL